MFCTNCGRQLNTGEIFCANCGQRIKNDANSSIINNNIYSNERMNRKNNPAPVIIVIVVLVLIVLSIIGIIVLSTNMFSNLYQNSYKLVCKSKEGNITIIYDQEEIIGYTVKGMSYDLDGQKEYADLIGIDEYILEFDEWFRNNTSGQCNVINK